MHLIPVHVSSLGLRLNANKSVLAQAEIRTGIWLEIFRHRDITALDVWRVLFGDFDGFAEQLSKSIFDKMRWSLIRLYRVFEPLLRRFVFTIVIFRSTLSIGLITF